MTTRSSTPSDYDLIMGDRLRGYNIKHTIEYTEALSASDIEIFKVDVLSDVSSV